MKTLSIIILLCLPALGLATVPSIPRLIHDDGPVLGVQPLVLEEEWRIGGEDEDVIFGRILDVARHPNGEVYVLDDGSETDLDLGHYERFTGVPLTRDCNYTTGQIYLSVIEKERQGEFLGSFVGNDGAV